MSKKVTLLVAGSWGTALASVLADNGHDVYVWTRSEQQAAEINLQHTNSRYLPGVTLSDRIVASSDMEEAVKGTSAIIIVAPSSAMRAVVLQLKPYYTKGTLIIHATKGFELPSLKRMSTVIAEDLDCAEGDIVVLSGPSHAEEVVKRNPTTIVVAALNDDKANYARDLFMNVNFRVYTNRDQVGVELAGALKNIIALGAGMSDGLGFGDNAKAAIITRGLAEISRVGVQMGANPLTFSGLAGVGDLVVTATSKHSRNWRAGYALGQGKPLNEVLEAMGMVVEGIRTTEAAHAISIKYNVQMPIADQLYQVLFTGKDSRTAVEALMGRDPKTEMEVMKLETWEQWHK
ncbi:NAD(P)H-dependent glycerol-3-phosphate dehydrogenase [Paenibacillus urinalis]|uniref:Glycerol-3-phosphate dehydrogenase [NAD(P)+] n=1 Tax=Paenibacillus urinalis TaxID=521520 RepID=A0ABY7X537_9BACL|nr:MULTISPECIES: NAD(P)H-dependent glycerol-3-phosphate dehydrogenase [Paenibacillus]WDH97300.1 NAD(P)H-dependent glycerol-3-phosphate dehydrogenase [Paenibacillus urinalis]WDI00963.1 NAD(P)H-dependent glycerol-3-phosphate dehydrogenase [Paenibacillus urinalis]GAK39991.1 glycerol-3-phosphate dehydrogenase [Paenibacillus sp. TCA20]